MEQPQTLEIPAFTIKSGDVLDDGSEVLRIRQHYSRDADIETYIEVVSVASGKEITTDYAWAQNVRVVRKA